METEKPSFNENQVRKEIKKEIEDIIESNENGTAYSHLWDAMKTVLSGKFITLYVFIKKLKTSHISNLKTMEQNNQTLPKGVDGNKPSNSELKLIDQEEKAQYN